MFVAAAVCSAVLAAVMALTAAQIATRQPAIVDLLRKIGAAHLAPLIATTSAAGAVGLVGGLVVAPLGVAAATGVLVQMVAAVAAHLRAGDRNLAPAAVVALLAIAALVLRGLS